MSCQRYKFSIKPQHIEDRPELWQQLKDDEWIYYYCLYIKDRPVLRKRLK